MKRKKVGLALGGGVARGVAHVGVLAALKEAEIPIDFIAGTSMGALVGSAYSAGIEIPELIDIAAQTRWHHICRPVWPRQGFLSFKRLEDWIINIIGDVDICDLAIPFAAVATDIETGERVVIREGPVSTAVRASCSVPGVATPILLNGRLLCDGGISDNLPDYAVRKLGAEYVIGVDVFAPAYRTYLGPFGAGLAAIETLIQHAGGGDLRTDCLIIPDLVGQSFLRLSHYDEFIDAGKRAAQEKIPTIKAAIYESSTDSSFLIEDLIVYEQIN